jgi:starch-binding outer membrane protein SusE/F
MKNIFNYICFAFFTIGFLTGCEKDETKAEFLGGTAPVLTSSTDEVDMNFANENNIGLSLHWTNPDYNFNSGRSSQSVTYIVEIDTAGANFKTPTRKQLSLTGDLGVNILVKELNDYLLNQMQLTPNTTYNLEIRVVASLDSKYSVLTSNVVSLIARPYSIPPKVSPPATGDLWMLGDATFAGWNNPIAAPYDNSQKFTKVSETVYEIVTEMPGAGGYKLIQENGVWATQYHMLAGGTWEGGDFEMKDAEPQFPGPPTPGTYKITIDFQRGKFSAVKQ